MAPSTGLSLGGPVRKGLLGIHVLGEGFGESIVITFPSGAVGVVDCFARRLKVGGHEDRIKANPTLRFLRQTLKAERLAFVALTHPHEDHGRGLSHLLCDYQGAIDEIWLFAGFETIDLGRYLAAAVSRKRQLPIEQLLDDPPGTFANEMMKIREIVDEELSTKGGGTARYRLFQGTKRVKITGEPLITIRFIGPADGMAHAYISEMTDGVRQIVQDDGAVAPDWEPTAINHNRISPSLMLEFGDTRILLGGDMETEAWAEVEREIDQQESELRGLECHLVKVSHHGSATGFTPTLYQRMVFRGEKPLAILTCFNRNKHPLPSPEGVAHLMSATRLLATNAAMAASSGMSRAWASMPDRWFRDIQDDPQLAGLLRPELVRGEVPRPTKRALPEKWLADIRTRPELVAVLTEEVVRRCAQPIPSELDVLAAHRVSIYFDDAGKEADRFVGSGAGELIRTRPGPVESVTQGEKIQ